MKTVLIMILFAGCSGCSSATLSLPRIDALPLLIGTLLGALVSTWFYFYIRQPKLRHIGTAGRSNLNCMTIQNEPGFLGFTFEAGGRLGNLIRRDHYFGLLVERMTARCQAHIHDEATNKTVPLQWLTEQGGVSDTITLEYGQSGNLILFATDGAEPGRYYIWESANLPDPMKGRIPPPDQQLEGERDYVVEIHYGDARKRKRFPGRVNRKASGSYRFDMPGGSSLI